jgi:gentisate 1,2-dioxygenase
MSPWWPNWHDFALEGGADGGVALTITDLPVFEALGFRDVSHRSLKA